MLSVDTLYCILKDVYPTTKIHVDRNDKGVRVTIKANGNVFYDYKFESDKATHKQLEHESVVHALTTLIRGW